ncbi:calmodulin-like [Melia azedarach]|uniref:Calmodulin-like n=1 Tax=Melia azedarach TaxID=155640 RepID=A0ACC1YFX5_MELAZ|nr:calmodulin-like [Melia azedarach]
MCPTDTSGTLRPRDMAPTSSPEFKPAFDALDADHDGKISRDDLLMFYARLGGDEIRAEDDVISTMISVADSNKDGYVEYDEFARVLCYGERKSVGGVMEDVFRVMDKDGDGRLSHEDLKSYMNAAGFSAGDEDIKAMIKLGGGSENGGVSFDGLLKILAVDCVGSL